MKSHRELDKYVGEARNAVIALQVLNIKVGKLVLSMQEQIERISKNLESLEGELEE